MYRLIAFRAMKSVIFKTGVSVANVSEAMEAANHSKNSAMEAENHVKHGASSKSLMSRGNFLKACFALSLAPTAIMIGCGGGSGSSGGGKSAKIKMTTEIGGDVSIDLVGSGTATVDWGDGSEKVSLTLNENRVRFEHTYPSATIRTISVNGDNITGLRCEYGKLTSLDVSRCTELTSLNVQNNQLTSLSVSKNTELVELNCRDNQLTSLDLNKNTALTKLNCSANQLTSLDLSKNTALIELTVSMLTGPETNALFGTLHSNSIPGAYNNDRRHNHGARLQHQRRHKFYRQRHCREKGVDV